MFKADRWKAPNGQKLSDNRGRNDFLRRSLGKLLESHV